MKTILALLALVAFAATAVAAPQEKAGAAQPAAAQLPNKGKVLEVIDTSMYTYLQVSGDKGPVWLAVSKTDIAKGTMISFGDGAVMSNFHSKSLNRTFDKIIFLDKVVPAKKK